MQLRVRVKLRRRVSSKKERMNMEHHHLPAAAAAAAEEVLHPTVMQPQHKELLDDMFIDGPPAWSQADMEQSSDMLTTYYDNDGTAFLILSDQLPAEDHHPNDTLKRDALPIQLPAAEVHSAMQPAPPQQPPQSVPSALPSPPTSSPPIQSKIRERWTEEEHELFADGLDKYGRGDWRSISSNCVTSKTPSQIASHAQKYFLRQISEKKRKSIHDKVIDKPHHQVMLPHHNVMVQEPDQPLLPQLTDHQELVWLLYTTGFF